MSRKDSNRQNDWRQLDPDDIDDIKDFEPIRQSSDNSLPASSKRQSKNASRKTEGSRKASKRIAQQIGGVNRRRAKRIE